MSATKQPQRIGHILAKDCNVSKMLEPAHKKAFLRAVQLERDPDNYFPPTPYGILRGHLRKSARIK